MDHSRFDFPEESLLEGDIVFRRGSSFISHIVSTTDRNGVYSHIGIVVKHDGKCKIVHAVPDEYDFEGDVDRIKMDDVETFFKEGRAVEGAVMRVDIDSLKRIAISERAIGLYKKNIPFDHDYDLSDTTKMYCSELVLFLYKRIAGIDLAEGRRSIVKMPVFAGTYIYPSDIEKYSKAMIIYRY